MDTLIAFSFLISNMVLATWFIGSYLSGVAYSIGFVVINVLFRSSLFILIYQDRPSHLGLSSIG